MAETLGMLCDKLTIVALKKYHTTDPAKLQSLNGQAYQLQAEINEYLADALNGRIPIERLTFDANKVYKTAGNEVAAVEGRMGEVMNQLAEVNCRLWHEQEKVYEFEKVPPAEKDVVVKKLAVLNLERNRCIDRINSLLADMIRTK